MTVVESAKLTNEKEETLEIDVKYNEHIIIDTKNCDSLKLTLDNLVTLVKVVQLRLDDDQF